MVWFKELAEIVPNSVMYAKVVLALLEYGDSPEFVEKMREVGTGNAIVMSIQVAKVMVVSNGTDDQRRKSKSYAN
jgi:hypothetical protein